MTVLSDKAMATGGTLVQVVIPAGAVVGSTALLLLTDTPSLPAADPTGWDPLIDSSEIPTQSTGYMCAWVGTITSTGPMAPGATVSVIVASSSRTALVIVVDDEPSEVNVVIPNFPGAVGNTLSVATLAGVATLPGKLFHCYGSIGNTAGAQPDFTAHASTTKLQGICSTAGTRNAVCMVAWESVAAGPTPGRAATTGAIPVQPNSLAIVLSPIVDRPTAALTSAESTYLVGDTISMTVTPSGGAGGPYGTLVTHVSGPATPTISGNTTTSPSFTPTVAGVYTVQAVVEDTDDIASLPDQLVFVVLGESDEARPISDVTTSGWTKEPSGAPSIAFCLADDSDETFARYELPAGATLKLRLGPVTPPEGTEDYTKWYRVRLVDGTSGTVQHGVMQGVTVIKMWDPDEWTDEGEVKQFEHLLTAAEYASVSDWNALDEVYINVAAD